MSAESPGQGQGSTFTVLLPLADGASTSATPSPGAKPDPSEDRLSEGVTVLLVDDEDDVREALRLILLQKGMVVATAPSAQEAFASCRLRAAA